jgi:hypothetical protein
MGFLTGGPFYDLIGRTGNNVGRRRKGKNTFSMRPSKSTKLATPAQISQRLKFGLATSWLSNALSIVQIGWQNYQTNGSAMNSAVKDLLANAILGTSPNFAIDYSKVQLSNGPLQEARSLGVQSAANAEIEISWLASLGSGKHDVTDKLVIFGYLPAMDEYVELIGAVTRGQLTYTMSVPAEFSGEQIHVWTSFVNAKGNVVSDSQFNTITLL